MGEWFADENFWTHLYPFLFSAERLESAESEVEKVIELVGFGGGAVLDLACGPGRHSVSLARKGHAVTGVDLSPFLLEKARARAGEAKVAIEWVQADMREFSRRRAFDLALSLFTSFGFFEREEDNQRVLENVYRSLRPGGVLVLEMAGKEWLARVFQATTSQVLDDGSILVERHQLVDDWCRVRNEWILINGDQARTFKFDHTIYSARELKERLQKAGFSTVRCFGDLEESEYGIDAKRLVAAAWR
jgi:SAM-dependent methyltransferase